MHKICASSIKEITRRGRGEVIIYAVCLLWSFLQWILINLAFRFRPLGSTVVG